MEIKQIELTDFRNYVRAEARLGPEVNLVVGRNGQGKTSLLEAVYCLSALGSHRAPTAASMVRHDQERAFIRARAVVSGREAQVDAEIARGSGVKVMVNRQRVGRTDRDQTPAAVLFSPEDLELIKGSPEGRRRFLDQAAAKTRPVTIADRQNLEKALRQRNGVLKALRRSSRAEGQLEVWTEQVASAGARVVVNRLRVLADLLPAVRQRYRELAVAEPPELSYEASWSGGVDEPDPEAIRQALWQSFQETLSRDRELATTTTGPHRDDLVIELAGAGARLFASQGEQRSLALSLRLAERDLATRAHGEEPIMLLDDVFSELDEQRRHRLGELVATSGQTIATATTAERLPVKGGWTLRVEGGELIEVG